jgi:lipopolysaccharide export system protein LptC
MAGTTGDLRIHQRLERRNRLVSILRIGLPAMGLIVLLGLVVQIYVGSLTGRFGVGRIEVTPDAVIVDAPEYAGALEDGSSYRVWAEQARAELGRTDLINLSTAQLVVDRPDGVQMQVDAAAAQLDTTNELTIVPGLADIADTTGTVGTLMDSVFDWGSQTLKTSGEVAIDYADGSSVRSEGLEYDASAKVWTFSRAVVTLPSTPGENPDAGSGE